MGRGSTFKLVAGRGMLSGETTADSPINGAGMRHLICAGIAPYSTWIARNGVEIAAILLI